MYAIVEIAGFQYKVEKDQQIFVHRLDEKEGGKVTFDKVLLMEDGKKITVGAPVIKGATVTATVNEHLKGDKVIVFKKKRRKGYTKKNGHRQYLSSITITAIGAKAPAKKAAPKAEKAETVEAKPAAKKPAAKKPAAKKTTAPKAEDKGE